MYIYQPRRCPRYSIFSKCCNITPGIIYWYLIFKTLHERCDNFTTSGQPDDNLLLNSIVTMAK